MRVQIVSIAQISSHILCKAEITALVHRFGQLMTMIP